MLGFIVALRELTKSHKDYEAMLNEAGMSQEAYDKMTKTLMFSLRRLRQSFILLAVRVGSDLRPAIERLSKAFLNLKDSTISTTLTFLKWAIAIYAVNKAIKALIFSVGILIPLMKMLKYVALGAIALFTIPAGMAGIIAIASNLLVALGLAAIGVAGLSYAFELAGKEQKKTQAAMEAVGVEAQNAAQNIDTLTDSIDNVIASTGQGTTAIKSLRDEMMRLSFGERFAKIAKAQIERAPEAQVKEIGRLWDRVEALKAIKEIQEKIQETRIAIAVFGMTDIEKQQYEIEQIIARIERLKTIGEDTGPLYLNELTKAAKELNVELESLAKLQALEQAQQNQQRLLKQGKRIFEQTRTPLEQYESKITELGKLLEAQAIDWNTYGRAVRQARKELEGYANKAGQFKVIRTAFVDPFAFGNRGAGTSRTSPNIPGIQNYDERKILSETTEQTKLLRSIEGNTARTANKEGLN